MLISATRAITSMAVNPIVPWYLAVGTADSSVTIFDRRRLSVGGKDRGLEGVKNASVCSLTVPELESSERFYRITSLNYSGDGKQILASYSSDYLYLFDTEVGLICNLSNLLIGWGSNRLVFCRMRVRGSR